MSNDQMSSRAVFQPVLDMSKWMEAEASKKVEVLTRAFVSLTKAQNSISRGHNLNDYWKTQLSSIESVVDALDKFDKKQDSWNSKGYADNFLKSYNAFLAMGGSKNDVISAFGGEIDELVSKAKQLSPLIAEVFSTDALKDAFHAFELMNELGVDLTDTFKALQDGSPSALNAALAEMNSRLSDAEQRAEAAESALRRFGDVDEIDELAAKLDNLRTMQDNVKSEFDQFLRRSGLYHMIDSDELSDYYENLASGYETPIDAISRFREQYATLMEQIGQADMSVSNGELDAFATKLERLFGEMQAVRSEIDELRTSISGIGREGTGGEIAQSVATELSQTTELTEAQRNAMSALADGGTQLRSVVEVLTELIRVGAEAQTNIGGLGEAIASITSSLASLGEIDGEKLNAIAAALHAIGEIGGREYNIKGIDQLAPALNMLSEVPNVGALQALSGVNLRGFNELHISKASLSNLATYLPVISSINPSNIANLAKIDFTKLNELHISKASVTNLKDLLSVVDIINEARQKIEAAVGVSGTSARDSASVSAAQDSMAEAAERVAEAERQEAAAAVETAAAERNVESVATEAAAAKQAKAEAATDVGQAESAEAEAAEETAKAEAEAAQAADEAGQAKRSIAEAANEAAAASSEAAHAESGSAEEIQAAAKVEADGYRQIAEAATEAAEAAAEATEESAKAAKKQAEEAEKAAKKQDAANRRAFAKDLTTKGDAITSSYRKLLRTDGVDTDELDRVRQDYIAFFDAKNKFASASGAVDQSEVDRVNAMADALRASISALLESARAHDENADSTERDAVQAASLERRVANLSRQITGQLRSVPGLEDSKYGKRLKEIQKELDGGSIDATKLSEYTAEVARLKREFTEAGYVGSGFFNTLVAGMKNIAGFSAMVMAFRRVIQYARKIVDAIKEIDAAMTELKKVTDLTSTGYKAFYEQAVTAAQKVGATVSDTINATAD